MINSFRKIYLLSFFITISFIVDAQPETKLFTCKFPGSKNKKLYILESQSDSISISVGIQNKLFSNRRIFINGLTYTFRFNKSEQRDEMFLGDSILVGYAPEITKKQVYRFISISGAVYAYKISDQRNWEVLCNEKTLVKARYGYNDLDEKVEITVLDSSIEESSIALLFTYIYCPIVIRYPPAPKGAIAGSTIIRTLLLH